MNTDRRRAIAALTAAGLAWGTTVPLSKLALAWLAPGWLTLARFGLAAAVLLAAASRPALRAACTPPVLASAVGRALSRGRRAAGRPARARGAAPAGRSGGPAPAGLPFWVPAGGIPAAPHGPGTVLAAAGLAAGGTLLPFTLFAYGQSRI